MKIAALILAAGASSRMGKTKQLLPLGDSTILKKVVETALKSNANRIYVILGNDAESVAKSISDLPVTTIINSNYKEGLSSSIVTGIKKLMNFDAVLIVLGDQPRIDAKYLNAMMETSMKNTNQIIASKYAEINGVPAIFPKQYYAELLQLKGDKGAKQFLNSDSISVKSIKTSVNLLDIDTPEDYERLIQEND